MFGASSRSCRVVGIDPGLTRCGYAVVDALGGSSVQARSLGAFTTSPQMELPERLASLQRDVRELLDELARKRRIGVIRQVDLDPARLDPAPGRRRW